MTISEDIHYIVSVDEAIPADFGCVQWWRCHKDGTFELVYSGPYKR